MNNSSFYYDDSANSCRIEEVDVFDHVTSKRYKIPANELTSDMIPVSVDGSPTFFVHASGLRSGREQWKVMPDGFRRIALTVFDIINSQMPDMDEKRWVDGFKKDLHPMRELYFWMRIAFAFYQKTHGRTDKPDIQRDVFSICTNSITYGANTLQKVRPTRISKGRARACVQATLETDVDAFCAFWEERLPGEDWSIFANCLGEETAGPN
jgi:hypothetical protein